MATRLLDRKARTAIAVAAALLLAGPLYLAAKVIIEKVGGTPKIVHPEDDQLVMLEDGSTMLIRHGSTGRIMADWLKGDPDGAKKFEVGNENFSSGSAALTPNGWEHLAQFSQMLKAHHEVSAVVLYSAYHGVPATTRLEHMRADRIHDEAIKQGVDEEQIKVVPEGFEQGHNAALDPGLEVVLTNRT